MLDVHIEKIGELAVVECEGRVLQNEAVQRDGARREAK
jgi:hypothetical protein